MTSREAHDIFLYIESIHFAEVFMIDVILLGFLYDGLPSTSYNLRKQMSQSTEFFQNNSLGSIQPGLKKLEGLGYLVSEACMEKNRNKTYYTITPTGKAYFLELLRQDLGPDKIKCNQLVKVFFFDKLTLQERLDSIDLYLAEVEQTYKALSAIEEEGEACFSQWGERLEDYPTVQFQMDTLAFGKAYYTFLTKWFTDFKQEVIERERKKNK